MQGLAERLQDRGHATALALKGTWSAHAAANRARASKQVGELWLDRNPRKGVLIAAGPSLKDSIPELLFLNRVDHELVCVDMALEYLLEQGVVPDYVICSDSSTEIQRTLVRAPHSVKLLLNVVVHPDTGKDWAGETYWFGMMSNYYDREANDWMQADHQKKSGVSSFLVPGGNVSSLGVSFLSSVRACAKVLLYGHDFCWADEFYAGGKQDALAQERMTREAAAGTILDVQDTQGRRVKTTGSLQFFADWYRNIDAVMPGLLEQRTPSTILPIGGTQK